MRQLDFGGVRVDKLLDDASWVVPCAGLFPALTPEMQREAFAALGERHLEPGTFGIRLSLHSTLVRTDHHIIIVDTCFGNDKERPAHPFSHRRNTDYLGRLRALGVAPEQVDYVCCTHLHGDHTGWNTMLRDGRWVPTFPNARYVMARREYDYWNGEYRADRLVDGRRAAYVDNVLPVIEADRALMIDESGPLCDHVDLDFVVGHTPGHIVVDVSGPKGRGVITGDVIHSPVQFHFPDLSTGACIDPVLSRTNRLKLIEKLADTSVHLLPAHFVDPTAGHIHRDGSRYRYEFIE